jgi:hypothetical protein
MSRDGAGRSVSNRLLGPTVAELATSSTSPRIVVRMDDGSEAEFGPGDVGSIPPGHDAWVVGDEPFIGIDFGDALYAKQQR